MSEPSGAGRARGRARGRPPTQPPGAVAEAVVPEAEGAEGGNGNGNGNGAAIRGRAGYRRVGGEPLRTIPPQVKVTRGDSGTPVRITSNYISLTTPKDVIVHDYHVNFEPTVEASIVRRALLYNHKPAFNEVMLFDGMSNIKSTKYLDGLDDKKERVFFSTRRTDNAQIKITVKHVNEVSWGHPEMMRLYNTQMRRNLAYLKWLLVGRYYYDPTIRHKIHSHKLEVWQGVQTAINLHDGGKILMVCDTVHKVIRADTVAEVMQDILRKDRANFQDNARRELSGAIVMSNYNNRTYKIDDIAFDKNPMFEFEKRNGEKISIKDYYFQQYNITIRDARQPLLVGMPDARQKRAGDTKEILLVPELCVMTGLSESLKSDFDVKKQMTSMTQAEPNIRVQNLERFINAINNNEDAKRDMAQWGFRFEPTCVEIPGRRLDGERIFMKDNQPLTFVQKSGDFSKEIRGKGMFNGVSVKKWVIFSTPRDRNLVDDFANTLNRVCRPMEVSLDRPEVQTLENDRTGSFVDACKTVPPTCQLAVIIVPNNNKERYDAVKKIFCCDHPIPSQVVVSRTLAKKQMLMSVCTKIGIQIAAKLGAEPWALDIPPKELMVCGFDVHRDSSLRSKTIGGFVCSVNPHLTKWYSRVAYHEGKEELSNNFKTNFTHGLKRYWEVNQKLPQRVVIYRDGVSEGDIEYVFNFELKQIEEAIANIGEAGKSIKLAFVIVTKRINARFFQQAGQRQYENPQPGTVVDNTVTRDERFDFFLISQSVRQGTVAPTQFNIIKDDTNWKPNHHQQLAYKLTHLYFNWPGTIRVPSPCQYAHKLAYLTGTALHKEPNTRLSDTLFYL